MANGGTDLNDGAPFFFFLVCPLFKGSDVISCLAEIQVGLTESGKGRYGNLALGL